MGVCCLSGVFPDPEWIEALVEPAEPSFEGVLLLHDHLHLVLLDLLRS
jgi:hypothetical protein